MATVKVIDLNNREWNYIGLTNELISENTLKTLTWILEYVNTSNNINYKEESFTEHEEYARKILINCDNWLPSSANTYKKFIAI